MTVCLLWIEKHKSENKSGSCVWIRFVYKQYWERLLGRQLQQQLLLCVSIFNRRDSCVFQFSVSETQLLFSVSRVVDLTFS